MNEQIECIINELLEIDPSLRGQEASMRKTIEKLIGERPDLGFDEAYKAELKGELLERFAQKNKAKALSRRIYFGLAAMLTIGVVALAFWFNSDKKPYSMQSEYENARSSVKAEAIHSIDPSNKELEKQRPGPETFEPKLPPPTQTTGDDKAKKGEKPDSNVKNKLGDLPRQEFADGIEGGVYGGVLGAAVSSEEALDYDLIKAAKPAAAPMRPGEVEQVRDEFNTEGYAAIHESDFLPAIDNPLSTFSIDVDTASYANTRRFLMQNRLPPSDAVRIEELINYFDYNYEQPKGQTPFIIHRELCAAPWNPDHKLVMVALQGRDISQDKLPPSNLVFLLDVSGSMNERSKLPLLKDSFKLLLRQLDKRDRVAIVVYAGAAGLVLPSTPATEKEIIISALDRLSAGGSTAGGAGISLAYQVAAEHFIKGGNNRVILATDGDFNIGASSDAEMERLIEDRRDQGVFLTVLGFGMGNYKDSKMEILADKGNGNYAYIDSLTEAKKVLVNDIRKTLFTIAKDVKIQLEFNPSRVGSYRLIGYENRMLKKEDFRDDKKDAGEVGAGHSVTVFYEIIPVLGQTGEGTNLKYQDTRIKESAKGSPELLTVRVRYKQPDGDSSSEISEILKDTDQTIADVSGNMRFASAVAEFGLLLRDSRYKGQASFDKLIERARQAMGDDIHGYRHEFIRLAEIASILKQNERQ